MSWNEFLSLTFTAGAVGGFVNALSIWFFGLRGINQFLGVDLKPKLTPQFVYPKITWGGIWGLLFILTIGHLPIFISAILVSIPPTLVQIFYVFPKGGKGTGGVLLGKLTPMLVIFYNLIWSLAAALWIRLSLLPT